MNIRLILLRHGRSLADDENVYEGRYDSPLTEVGFAQARRRLEDFCLQNLKFDRIIASPLKRAKAVAEVMGEGLDVPVELDADWMEMDNGKQAGLSFEESEQRFPKPAFRNPYHRPFESTGESQWDVYGRAARAVQSVIHRGSGSYMVVAHGGILTTALWTIAGIQPSVNGQGFWFSFGDLGYAVLEYRASRHVWVFERLEPGF